MLSRIRPWTAAYQAPPSMGFSRQEYWSGVPLPSQELYILWGLKEPDTNKRLSLSLSKKLITVMLDRNSSANVKSIQLSSKI